MGVLYMARAHLILKLNLHMLFDNCTRLVDSHYYKKLSHIYVPTIYISAIMVNGG